MKIALDKDRFFLEAHIKLQALTTRRSRASS